MQADKIPDEIMQEAKEIANRAAAHVRNNADAEAVVNIVTRMVTDALLARDTAARKECVEIARGGLQEDGSYIYAAEGDAIAAAIEATIGGRDG